MKRLLILLLAFFVMGSCFIPVDATARENLIQPRWSYVSELSANISIDWLGVATCTGGADTYGSYTVKTVVYLHQYVDSEWDMLKSWSATGISSTGVEGKFAVARGYTYRVTVVAYVYDSNGKILETVSTTDTAIF